MASSSFRFPYGASFLKARIPAQNLAAALSRTQARGLGNEMDAVTRALRNPIGCPPLASLVSRKTKVAVIVTDNTRACPDERLLPPILDELTQKLPGENITIIIGLGLHPPLDKAELVQKLGKKVFDNYRAINHDINDVFEIGTTSRGTPVEVNRRVAEADFRISTGFIEPHFFAGFSGGCKSIAPGVSQPQVNLSESWFQNDREPFLQSGHTQRKPHS